MSSVENNTPYENPTKPWPTAILPGGHVAYISLRYVASAKNDLKEPNNTQYYMADSNDSCAASALTY